MSLLRYLRPDYVIPLGLTLATLIGGVVIVGIATASGARINRLAYNEARCLGWCEAHGYDRAFHDGNTFDVAACYCAAPVGSDVALAPIPTSEAPSEDLAVEGASE